MAGTPPRKRTIDYKTQVRKYENLNAPHVEYRFSDGRTFKRRDGQSGIYNPDVPVPTYCGVNLTFLTIQGTPSVVVTDTTTMTATNIDGSSFSVGAYFQTASYQSTTATVHQEISLTAESQVGSFNSIGMVFAASNSSTDNIAGFSLRPNTGSGAGSGTLLDAVSGGTVLSNMTVPVGSYVASLDLNHATKVCTFKDNQGQTTTLSVKNSAWEAAPVYVGAGPIAGNTLNDSIQCSWNPGTAVDQLQTTGAVQPCEAT